MKKRKNNFKPIELPEIEDSEFIYTGNSDISAANLNYNIISKYNDEIMQQPQEVNQVGILAPSQPNVTPSVIPFQNQPEEFSKPINVNQGDPIDYDMIKQQVQTALGNISENNVMQQLSQLSPEQLQSISMLSTNEIAPLTIGSNQNGEESSADSIKVNIIDKPSTPLEFRQNAVNLLQVATISSNVVNELLQNNQDVPNELIEKNYSSNVTALLAVNTSMNEGSFIPPENQIALSKNVSDSILLAEQANTINNAKINIDSNGVLKQLNKLPDVPQSINNRQNINFLDKLVNYIYKTLYTK